MRATEDERGRASDVDIREKYPIGTRLLNKGKVPAWKDKPAEVTGHDGHHALVTWKDGRFGCHSQTMEEMEAFWRINIPPKVTDSGRVHIFADGSVITEPPLQLCVVCDQPDCDGHTIAEHEVALGPAALNYPEAAAAREAERRPRLEEGCYDMVAPSSLRSAWVGTEAEAAESAPDASESVEPPMLVAAPKVPETPRERAYDALLRAGLEPGDWLRLDDPTETSLSRYLTDALRGLRQSRIRQPTTRDSHWASDAGHACERYLYYWRTDGESAEPHDAGLQAVFDLGKLFESWIKRELSLAGVELQEAEMSFRDPSLQWSGKMDCSIKVVDTYWVVDLKSTARHIASSFLGLPESEHVWQRQYPGQLALYVDGYQAKHPERAVQGALVFTVKTNGDLQVLEAPKEALEDTYDEVSARLIRVNSALRRKRLPARVSPEMGLCGRCPFALSLCDPDEPRRPPVSLTTDAALLKQLNVRADCAEMAKAFKAADKAIKTRLKITDGFEALVAGDSLITRTTRSDGVAVFKIKHKEQE